jgi:predicted deacylase
MQIGHIVGEPGKIVSGRLTVGYTTAQIPVELPVTLVMGAKPGLTLAVSGGVHGREIIGPLGVGQVLRGIDPQEMTGNLIAIPLANMSSFEFGERNSLWDNGNMEDAGGGKLDGSLTDRLAYHMVHDVIGNADGYIEIHSASAPTFCWYNIYLDEVEGASEEVLARSKEMGLAWGLEEVWAGSPWSDATKIAVMQNGIPSCMPEIGGGADFFRHGEDQVNACARGITNVMKLMGILPGTIETESDKATIWNPRMEFFNDGPGGLMVRKVERKALLRKGDLFGVTYDPTTGQEINRQLVPEDGHYLATGLVWPHCPAGAFLGVLGDPIEEIDLTTHEWTW